MVSDDTTDPTLQRVDQGFYRDVSSSIVWKSKGSAGTLSSGLLSLFVQRGAARSIAPVVEVSTGIILRVVVFYTPEG